MSVDLDNRDAEDKDKPEDQDKPADQDKPKDKEKFEDPTRHYGLHVLVGSLIALGVWVLCLGIYAFALGGADAFAIGLLVGVAALLAGALAGFIFAIPRSPPVPTGGSQTDWYRSNSNLSEISDWLTKILVGLGLVQFGRVLDGSRTVVDSITAALGSDEAGSDIFAAAVLVIFSITGFLSGYVMTRIRLGPIFAASEHEMRASLDRIGENVASVSAQVATMAKKVATVDEKVASVDEKVASGVALVDEIDQRTKDLANR